MNTEKMSVVAYYRVSTKEQGASGLGLESQKQIVRRYAGDNEVIAEFTEVESGKNNNRIELTKAIAYAKQAGAVLVVAKLDRLSRNAAFLLSLRDSQVNFIAADIPDANILTIGVLATIAQHEREVISSRTKAALQVKKQQGYIFGHPENLTDYSRERSIQVRTANMVNNTNNQQAACVISTMREAGKTLKEIADHLNQYGFKTRRGCEFSPIQVQRIYKGIILPKK